MNESERESSERGTNETRTNESISKITVDVTPEEFFQSMVQFDRSLYEPVSISDRFSKLIATNYNNKNELIFLCDPAGLILNINYNVQEKLLFSPIALKGQFIGCIMSDFVAMLHSEHIFPAFKRANSIKRSAYSAKINALTDKRPLIIYDAQKKPYFVEISVNTVYTTEILPANLISPEDLEYYFVLHVDIAKSQNDPTHLYVSGINHLRQNISHFKETNSDVVVICIDFIKSTELLESKGPFNLAMLNQRFYETAESLIMETFYPYVNFHEIIGDCFVFVVNAEWGCKIENYCASIAINFVNQLRMKSKDFVGIRIGLSFGKLVIGFIGNALRFFGDTIHRASRLEHLSGIDYCLLDTNFVSKLNSELNLVTPACKQMICTQLEQIETTLKGFTDSVACFKFHYLNTPGDIFSSVTTCKDNNNYVI